MLEVNIYIFGYVYKELNLVPLESIYYELLFSTMEAIEINDQTYVSVADFYAGKSVFVTGAIGFIGKVLFFCFCMIINKLTDIFFFKYKDPCSWGYVDLF